MKKFLMAVCGYVVLPKKMTLLWRVCFGRSEQWLALSGNNDKGCGGHLGKLNSRKIFRGRSVSLQWQVAFATSDWTCYEKLHGRNDLHNSQNSWRGCYEQLKNARCV